MRGRARGAAALVHPDLRGARRDAGSAAARRSRTACAGTSSCILTRRGLPELLRYEDRNSMAHSIEARVPFLDYRLVELLVLARGRAS